MTIVSTLQEVIRRLTRQEKAAEDIKRLVTNSPLHAGKAKALTIAGGAVEATRPHIQLAPETGLTDDLDNITNFGDGKFVVLSLQDGADTITVRDTAVSAGNIDLGGSNIILAEPEDNILLYYVATTAKWHKVGGAGSGAYSDELAQDAVGAMLADTATIDLTYTDATPELKADVIADSITNTLLANMAQNTIKGRITAGTGDPEDLTATQVRTIINVEDGANLYVHPNHTGDVTSVGDGATTIADDVVTNAKLAEVATSTIKGRATAGTGNPEDLTATQVRTVINVEDGADVTDAGNVGAAIVASAEKVTIHNDDRFAGNNSEATNVLAWWKFSTIKSTLKTYFDTLYGLLAAANTWTQNNAFNSTATTGSALSVTRNLTAASTDSPVVSIVQDHASDDQVAVRIQQDSAGSALRLKKGTNNSPMLDFEGGYSITEGGLTLNSGFFRGTSDDAIAFTMVRASAANALMGAGVNGDTFRRFLILADGALLWGDGTATRDTTLYRSAADTLKTDDSLVIDGALTVKPGTASDTAKVGGILYVSTTQGGNVGTGEDNLASYSVPANTLAANGQSIWFEAAGTFAATAAAKMLGVRFGTAGTNLILDAPDTVSSASVHYWVIKGRIVRTGAATQKAYATCFVNPAGLAGGSVPLGVVTTLDQTLSGAVSLRITGEATDNNDILLESFIVGWDGENT